MKNITDILADAFIPQSALLFYKNELRNKYYIESLDMDSNGKPMNAHPLSVGETDKLVNALAVSCDFKNKYLVSEGLLPENILYLDMLNGSVIWHTPECKRLLYFREDLGIPNGMATVPALVWKADKEQLHIYAVKERRKPTLATPLCYAPFFNIYEDGRVCMGTVDIDREPKSLEQFTEDWETYFFNSYFSHLLDNYNPIKGNLVQIWQRLIGAQNLFPKNQLLSNDRTLQDLIN